VIDVSGRHSALIVSRLLLKDGRDGWYKLNLEGQVVDIDFIEYFIGNLSKILGILSSGISSYK
jgi:hypothetical protein